MSGILIYKQISYKLLQYNFVSKTIDSKNVTFLFNIVCVISIKFILLKMFKEIFKLCFVFIQEGQITVLSFFLFSENPLIKSLGISALMALPAAIS